MRRANEPMGAPLMPSSASGTDIMDTSSAEGATPHEPRSRALDAHTSALVRVAAVIAVGDEPELREGMLRAVEAEIPIAWMEEVVLQSYMFSGFPRCLNAAREWRRASGHSAAPDEERMDFENVSR